MNGVKIRRIMTMSVFSGILYGFGVGSVPSDRATSVTFVK